MLIVLANKCIERHAVVSIKRHKGNLGVRKKERCGLDRIINVSFQLVGVTVTEVDRRHNFWPKPKP